DLRALLNLKSFLIGPGGAGLHDWAASSSTHYCNFSGVTCNEYNRVTSLAVSNVSLMGSLSSDIGLLDKLVNLTLAGDNLTGPLPLLISPSSSLKYVNLSWNFFSGNIPRVTVLTFFYHLQVFDVYNNNFTGPLPWEFVKLKKLKYLRLAGNYFSGVIPEIYSAFKSLTHLALQGNSLTGKIPASLSRIPTLQELYLGYFNSYDGGIPTEFGSISTLQLLDLGMCNLSGEIPKTLGNLKHLHTLFLQANNLTGQIPAELAGMTSLMSLDVSVNNLTGEIPGSFSQLTNLTLLNLFHNNFYGPLPGFIGDLPNLEVLQIWSNDFTLQLPGNLGRNGRLMLLDVTQNRLTGTIPVDLCRGGRLKTLILMSNFFYGPLPELGGCKSLTRIRIRNNFLNGSIPAGIFGLPLLDMLELDDNLFTGYLPENFSASSLTSLTMSRNSISGNIPAAMRSLINLEKLLLDMNNFSGAIPGEVFELDQLWSVNFSGNSLSGAIPASIGKCSKLQSIDFSRNKLSGEIPVTLPTLPNLGLLNLSRNQLDGDIPSEIGLMKSLTVVDLSYNLFSGEKPKTGLFNSFDDRYFAGNPNLCPVKCRGRSGKKHVALIFIVVVVSSAVVYICYYGRYHLEKLRRRRWKITSFQKLDLRAEDVLDCLREENIIGKGGGGIVYRGTVPPNDIIAIKLLTRDHDDGFTAEIETLGKIKHRNIVRLLGYMSDGDSNLLMYEYMPNGSLGEMIHGSKGSHLQWDSRYRIAVEAARGLCYLHHHCSPSIIHRDVKSNNILLDSDLEAHVADFGLAKFYSEDCMSAVAGSYGYIAPEYAYTLKVDQKSDVYSFGVVLLELITGRKPVGDFGEGVDIVRWVRKMAPSESSSAVMAVIDSRLTDYRLSDVVKLFKIAMVCVEDESSSRPTMAQVLRLLEENPP
ncbi:hypothetical protein M569_04011, partial [Genlisea aurea]